MRPGHQLVLIDLSPSGALVEAGRPLRPGARVEIHLESDHGRGLLKARVTRCSVAALSAAGVTYRAALVFEESCEWIRECETRGEYQVPMSAPQNSPRYGKELPGAEPEVLAGVEESAQ